MPQIEISENVFILIIIFIAIAAVLAAMAYVADRLAIRDYNKRCRK